MTLPDEPPRQGKQHRNNVPPRFQYFDAFILYVRQIETLKIMLCKMKHNTNQPNKNQTNTKCKIMLGELYAHFSTNNYFILHPEN